MDEAKAIFVIHLINVSVFEIFPVSSASLFCYVRGAVLILLSFKIVTLTLKQMVKIIMKLSPNDLYGLCGPNHLHS